MVRSEKELLESKGHEVYFYERSNEELKSFSAFEKAKMLASYHWSKRSYSEVKKIMEEFEPDIAHFHNIFIMLTPSVYKACQEKDVPVVQSLHNFRLLCSNGVFFRDGHVCEDCLESNLFESVKHRCYRGSFFQSYLISNMIDGTWKKRIWTDVIDRIIVSTEFTKGKYVEGGIPEEKIVVKPHFVMRQDVSMPKEQTGRKESFVLYAGRVSEEKGARFLIEAWKHMPSIPLKIVGDGPLTKELKKEVHAANVEFLGFVDEEKFESYMRNSSFIVVPSTCYENFPRVVVEAYSYGKPVVVPNHGSFPHIVKDGETGYLFNIESIDQFVSKVTKLFNDHKLRSEMSSSAFQQYLSHFYPEKNYEMLMNIYKQLIK